MNMTLRSALDAYPIRKLIVFQTGEHHLGIKAETTGVKRRLLRRLRQ